MYRAVVPCLGQNIGSVSTNAQGNNVQKIFVPFLTAYEIHSITMQTGVILQSEEEFDVNLPFIEWKCDPILNQNDKVQLLIDYFYKTNPHVSDVKNLADIVIDCTIPSVPSQREENVRNKRKEIFAKHLVDGLFAIDVGFYKEAVLNFGTVLEVLLNLSLQRAMLGNLVQTPPGHLNLASVSNEMTAIKDSRNKIHVNQLENLEDVNRKEALTCRTHLDKVLSKITDVNLF